MSFDLEKFPHELPPKLFFIGRAIGGGAAARLVIVGGSAAEEDKTRLDVLSAPEGELSNLTMWRSDPTDPQQVSWEDPAYGLSVVITKHLTRDLDFRVRLPVESNPEKPYLTPTYNGQLLIPHPDLRLPGDIEPPPQYLPDTPESLVAQLQKLALLTSTQPL